jgi:hypothetical protein
MAPRDFFISLKEECSIEGNHYNFVFNLKIILDLCKVVDSVFTLK